MINITKIYLVTNCYGDSNKVYIGKTTGSRKAQHINTFGIEIVYTYIDEVYSLNRKDWKPIESYWIEQFRQWGFEVVNKNKKGGGGPEFRDEDFKRKMRKPKTEEWKQALRKPKRFVSLKGPKSEETKQKISRANSKPKPEGFGENHRIKMIGKSSPKKGKGKPIIQIDPNSNYTKVWDSVMNAAYSLNKRCNLIYDCCIGKVKTAYGYIWKYL